MELGKARIKDAGIRVRLEERTELRRRKKYFGWVGETAQSTEVGDT